MNNVISINGEVRINWPLPGLSRNLAELQTRENITRYGPNPWKVSEDGSRLISGSAIHESVHGHIKWITLIFRDYVKGKSHLDGVLAIEDRRDSGLLIIKDDIVTFKSVTQLLEE